MATVAEPVTRVPLAAGEVVPDDALAVRATPQGGRYVPQRCAALQGTVCGVYTQRPLACRRYECLLFGALREGEVSLPEALAVVSRSKQLSGAELEEYLRFHFVRRA